MDPDLKVVLADLVRGDVPSLYLLLDDQDRVLEANRHTRELMGRPLVGEPFGELVVNFDRAVSPTALARSGPVMRVFNLVAFTGLPLSFECWITPVGRTVVVVGGVPPQSQETLRRELLVANQSLAVRTRELQQANGELLRLSRLKDLFLGMAAHDLRGPISAIASFEELLREHILEDLGPKPAQYLDGLRSATEQMAGIVNGFLDVALIESGRLELDLAPVPLAEVAETALLLAMPAARSKGISLSLAADEAPTLAVDRLKLQQVLLNLLQNAVQHSWSGSPVRLEAGPDAGGARIAVIDRGTGIAADLRKDLFTAFVHDGQGKTAGERSIGLGLLVSRHVVEAHGGRIEAEATPGGGTTVTVHLPGQPPAAGGP